jgi:hypothetical protein
MNDLPRRAGSGFGHLALVLALALPRQGWGASADQADDSAPQPGVWSRADRLQGRVSRDINGAARWIDSFFDDERYAAEDATTKLRLGQSVFLESGATAKFRTRASVSVYIPRTEKRLRLFIASEEDASRSTDTLFEQAEPNEDASTAGLQFFASRTDRQNLSLTTGIKLSNVEVFIGPRYRYNVVLKDWQLRFTQRLHWFTGMGWEATTRLDFEHLLSDRLFFRQTLDGRWREEDPGYRYEIRPTLIQRLSSRKLIEYRWNSLFRTSPHHRLDSTVLQARFRRNFLRKWLFYEINPQIAFRNDENFHPKAGITFQVDVVFGGKEFLGTR